MIPEPKRSPEKALCWGILSQMNFSGGGSVPEITFIYSNSLAILEKLPGY